MVKIHYIDASVLVKVVVDEDKSEEVRKYINSDPTLTFLVTSICFAETLGVLKKKFKKHLKDEMYLYPLDELRSHFEHRRFCMEEIPIKISFFLDAEEIIRKYNIDIGDAFQIISMKSNYFSRWKETRPILMTADGDLATAARCEGLQVWDIMKQNAPP